VGGADFDFGVGLDFLTVDNHRNLNLLTLQFGQRFLYAGPLGGVGRVV